MKILERLGYAFWGGLLGWFIGVLCWWLYGLAHSLNYKGPEMDPILRHWTIWCTAGFATLGFVFRDGVLGMLADTISGILHFEFDTAPPESSGRIVMFVCLVIVLAAIWFTVPEII